MVGWTTHYLLDYKFAWRDFKISHFDEHKLLAVTCGTRRKAGETWRSPDFTLTVFPFCCYHLWLYPPLALTVNVLLFYYKDHFSAFLNFLRSCIATVHLTLKIRQLMILILLVNFKIMKEKFYSFRYNEKKGKQKIKSYTVEVVLKMFLEQLERSAPLRLRFVRRYEHECICSKLSVWSVQDWDCLVFSFSFSKWPWVILSLSDVHKIFTSDKLWIEVCQNAVFSKIDITMTTINKKTWNIKIIFINIFQTLSFNSRDKLSNKKVLNNSKLIFITVRRLLNIIFRCIEILVYFLSCEPKN